MPARCRIARSRSPADAPIVTLGRDSAAPGGMAMASILATLAIPGRAIDHEVAHCSIWVAMPETAARPERRLALAE